MARRRPRLPGAGRVGRAFRYQPAVPRASRCDELRAARVLLAAVVVIGCRQGNDEQEDEASRRAQGPGELQLSDADRAALGLEVAAAELAELPDTALRFGTVSARSGDDATVPAPSAARVVKPALVELGAEVVAGAPLAELVPVLGAVDAATLGVQGAEVRGQIAEAESELVLREAELARSRDLARDKIVSAAKLAEVESQVASLRARIRALRGALRAQSGAAGKLIVLRAPVGGTVVALDVDVGAVVEQGHVIARILRPGPRWIDLAVSPAEEPAAAYEVEIASRWVPARLVSRGAVVGPDGTRHDRLQVDADRAAQVTPGATAAVRLARAGERGVVVSEGALVPGAGGDGVFVETGPGRFQLKTVRVAARFGGRARVASGLEAGDRVVTRGAMALRGELLRSQLGEDDD